MKKYFLHNGTEQEGPFSVEDLKSKNVSKVTPIWYEGLPEWTIVGNVEELKELYKNITPPPFNSSKLNQPEVEKKVEHKIAETNQASSNFKYLIKVLQVLAVIIIVAFVAIQLMKQKSTSNSLNPQTYQEKIMTVEEIERAEPARFLDASGTYNETLFGNSFRVHGVISNKATVASYKDALVQVTYYSKTKTKLAQNNYTIYDVFPPHSETKFEIKIANYKDVSTIGWDVISAKPN